ncbi:hypothetical protein J2S59_000460 [Nocardioides massiliensis]|uniref:Bacterial transcriptional activator domain-containing protein n=2 Tax=Nocardioides massiliensis TaxID=1325935 RepID=A0ABT9NJY5_9ACTN|nr:hypothetical protein [Nocardioides massiliensis]MDP9820651.1 hypothetical protein [Nocardioides massiliensis]
MTEQSTDPTGTARPGETTLSQAPDPNRFTGTRKPEERPERRFGEVIGAGFALLLLVVGLPAALLALGAPPPIPTQAPSLAQIARELSAEDLITVLVAIVWLTWLYFLVCVVVEVVAALRGGLARSVPLAGPLQSLARILVGALLMTGILAAPAQAAMGDGGAAASAGPAVTATQVAGSVGVGAVVGTVEGAAAVDQDVADQVEQRLEGHKVYTVKAPQNGYHDNLWDIAERHLGDGRRYTEIFELNKDRIQPDGRRLDLARLIHPGWELVMPEDASGVPRFHAPVEAPAAPQPGGALAGADAGVEVGAGAGADAGDAASGEESVSQAAQGAGGLVAAAVLGALLLARRRRLGRRPEDDALAAEEQLRVSATPERASWLDVVLRDLALRCRQAQLALPPAYAAIVGDDGIELRLAPALSSAPEGWQVAEDGAVWRRTADLPPLAAAATEVAPYPGLVSIGVDDDGRDVLIDLEAAGGMIALTGDATVASQVAASVAVQTATAAWAEGISVTAAGLPHGVEEIGDARLRVTDDLRSELEGFEASIANLRGDVLSGRMSRRGFSASQLVVCGLVPDDDVADRLRLLTGRGRQAFSVLIAGDHRSARWRLTVDENGVLELPQLQLSVHANRMSAAEVEAVAELFGASREEPVDHGDRVAIPAPARAHDDAAWATAERRVGVLGPVAVQGGGVLPEERAELAREMVVFLAMQPEPVHPNVLAGAIWPRGVTADVRDRTVERVRAWLGTAEDGTHYLRADADGRLSLADGAVCDWDAVRTLLISSRQASSARDEVEKLRRALQLVRGEPFAATPTGRYGWVAREDLPRVIARVLIDASHRLATLLLDDDPNGAVQAAEAGLRVAPGSQLLWRDLIRARHGATGIAGVQQTLDQMGDGLAGVPLEPETEALVQDFLPDSGTIAAG